MTITLDRGYWSDDMLKTIRETGFKYNVVCPFRTSNPFEEVQVDVDEEAPTLTEFQVPMGRYFCPGTSTTAEAEASGPLASGKATRQTVYASMVRERDAVAKKTQGTSAVKFMSNAKWRNRLVTIPAHGCNRMTGVAVVLLVVSGQTRPIHSTWKK